MHVIENFSFFKIKFAIFKLPVFSRTIADSSPLQLVEKSALSGCCSENFYRSYLLSIAVAQLSVPKLHWSY